MSEEDRTQAPSKARLQQARERGQVAHSAELTGAAVLLAVTVALGAFGEPLVEAFLHAIRDSWTTREPLNLDPQSFVDHLRATTLSVFWPLCGTLFTAVAAGILAHQAQVQGLFSPGLIAPDIGRLWNVGAEELSAKLVRGLWSLAKSTLVLIVAGCFIQSRQEALLRLGSLGISAMAHGWASALRELTLALALTTLALGLLDFAWRHQRFGAMLRLSPAESREDQKAAEGDPAVRSRRLRQAKAWRGDSPELLAGVSRVVVGPGGLIVLLTGGPPPKKINVRSSAKGSTGTTLRKSAERLKVPRIEHASMARRLAMLRDPRVPAELLDELATVWDLVTPA